MERKPISKKLRFEVFKRDKFTCTYCGKRPPDVILEPDHILPVSEGGETTLENLTTACYACNRGKAGIPLEDVAPAIDEMQVLENIQEMLERKLSIQKSTAVAKATEKAERRAIDTVHTWWKEAFGFEAHFEEASVRHFVQRLELESIRQAVNRTELLLNQKPWQSTEALWRYFCGICWNKIREKKPGDDR